MLFSHRQRSKKQLRSRRQNKANEYQDLEQRNLLAVTSLFEAGVLTVNLGDSGDNAVVRTINNVVTVNDQQIDADPNTAGLQALQRDAVTNVSFFGAAGINNLGAHINGNFDTGNLSSVTFQNINTATMNGIYDVDFVNGNFVGPNSSFDADGRLVVNDSVNFTSATSTTFSMLNATNDFRGVVNIDTGGDVMIREANSVVLGNVDVGGFLTVRALDGSITNVGDVSADRVTTLQANSVELGTVGEVDLAAVITDVSGHFDLVDADSVVWAGNSTAGSAHISARFVGQGPTSQVNIVGDAEFDVRDLQLGVGGLNTFNSGRINFNVIDHAFIFENSGVQIYGNNTATDLDLIAAGDIRNVAGATLNVTEISAFQSAQLVDIGNANGDQFNTGTLQFRGGDVRVSEDSNTLIDGLANFAQNLTVEAAGTITDTNDAYIVIQNDARFISSVTDPDSTLIEGVTIGNSTDDFFIAGSVSFQVENGTFNLSEDNATIIDGADGFVNQAEFAAIQSAGTITNRVDTTINVERNALFNGQSITIGRRSGDTLNLGSATFVTPGDATITEDSGTLLGGNTFVGGSLDVQANGNIQDSQSSFVNVQGRGTFVGNNITLGDLPGVGSGLPAVDNFTLGGLHFEATGDVDITENSSVTLAQETISTGNDVRLASMGDSSGVGNISNSIGSGLMVSGNLQVEAISGIFLGTTPGDVINFDNLNFSANDNVIINAFFEDNQDEFFIFGGSNNRNTANQLQLSTNVDVRDGTFAEIEIDEFIRIEARNITLGDTDDDCLMIPSDAIFVTADQDASVNTNTNC